MENNQSISNTQKMCVAYGLLYEVETTLVEIIEKTLRKKYGLEWPIVLKVRRPLETSRYYEIVGCYVKYEPLKSVFTKEEQQLLFSLDVTRNKIAHMKVITDSEMSKLEEAHLVIGSRKINTTIAY
ncbi:hypothetical protein [Evansella cellulosilytica]|uniref:Uncharacterized protein n=1 Tax=Evansella cellulosilytica (strain ATCC 21833 / DSM 2522 / FERM P-1141 / JCM 9156 / N-4) TaxID=649639 RepID=E6TTD2_EVAC2|nr:hypothetical protein [Evansella cellulosilytica]ADU28472.1 hypothetical protein Bcell_0183 [Evansella cellulosilytica DSM 2522]